MPIEIQLTAKQRLMITPLILELSMQGFAGQPGMLLAQISTEGLMRVQFIPHTCGKRIQEAMGNSGAMMTGNFEPYVPEGGTE